MHNGYYARTTALLVVFLIIANIVNPVSCAAERDYSPLYDFADRDEVENMRTILTGTLGFSPAAASGILTNMVSESRLMTNATGDKGTSYGLCQWYGKRLQCLKEYASDNKMQVSSRSLQVAFIKKEMYESFRDLQDLLNGFPNTETGAYKSAFYFCTNYEAPKESGKKGAIRGYQAALDFRCAYPELAELETEDEKVVRKEITEEEIDRYFLGDIVIDSTPPTKDSASSIPQEKTIVINRTPPTR